MPVSAGALRACRSYCASDEGLELLQTLPEALARKRQELALRLALGGLLRMTKGNAAPEVEQTYARARALCQQVEDAPQLGAALAGLGLFYFQRAELQTARALAEQLLAHAQRRQDPVWLMQAHQELGHTAFHLGMFAAARSHLEQAMTFQVSDYPLPGSMASPVWPGPCGFSATRTRLSPASKRRSPAPGKARTPTAWPWPWGMLAHCTTAARAPRRRPIC